MAKFTITTNHEVASKIEMFFNSSISEGRSIVLVGVIKEEKYCDVVIASVKEDEKIDPVDIFWMGFYSNDK